MTGFNRLVWPIFLTLATATLFNTQVKASNEVEQNHANLSMSSHDAERTLPFYQDLDQDGIDDQLDHCPNTLLGVDVNPYGCELDSDQDGVFDRLDHCPGTLKGARVNVFGCESDEDGDGVFDRQDACPHTPAGKAVNQKGCLLIQDSDRDGINDSDDQCPNTPAKVVVNEHGCEPKSRLLTHILFDPNSSIIRSDQIPRLKQDTASLSELSAEDVILITGHTDNQGSITMNLELSWHRAQSTKDFMVNALGYQAERVYILGAGETSPIADNSTAEGRQQNRRIEFSILKRAKLPANSALETASGLAPSQRPKIK